ncbi:FAD-dependent oxidoreductase [Microtetraspora sp. NBRC 16547]|uniref:GcvT family protein n=1 Tax=Microtetraspora sp. NBRC 16547 TaxID=3030993 RepID=UPI0024A10C4C|nr:FAD-dependent oxidoreductase [Microtetraspora sp. NBRC 16547]GLW97514.1 FAD-dependent oxidoreductase [Microtetraspora sp. NBRC 16547]
MSRIPAEAQAVVIGGGVAGCSVAYHLARLGWTDVILVERHDLTEGTTWHSAGFVGQLRSTVTQTRMIMYSAGLYPELRELTGLDPGWNGVGGLRLATTPERHEELLRQAAAAETYGLDMEVLDRAGTLDRLPLLEVADVRAALWLPGDGWLDPARLGRALAEGARRLGVRILTGVEVTGIDVTEGPGGTEVRAVRLRDRSGGETDGETGGEPGGEAGGEPGGEPGDEWVVRTRTVVNAAGAAAGVVGRLAGVDVPIVPIKHQYVVTAPKGVPADTPTVRDPDNIVYFREEDGGILVGGYIRTPQIWDTARPLAEPRTLFAPDMPKFQESWASAVRRLPILRDVGPGADPGEFRKVVHGPEAFTPDGEFLLGETATRGFWVAAGFCVHGLAAAGGVGKVMAEWIVDGTPEYDVFGMDIRRFGGHARSARWARAKALDSYSKYYDIVYPGEERTAARPLRRSPAWVRHAELKASFGEKAGWERVNWYESNADEPCGCEPGAASERVPDEASEGGSGVETPPSGWAGKIWSPAIGRECLATQNSAGLFDQTSFAKLEISGESASAMLGRACAGRIDRPVGTVVYTQLLNERGGIEADVTVTRLTRDRFRLVTGTAFGVHDAAWLRRHHSGNGVEIRDVTSAYACYCLWGPKAYDILSGLTDDDLTFGYLRAREISVGHVPVLAQRVTFVGEFGWELYCPIEYGLTLWDTLMDAGLPHGMLPAGYRALDALRLEKGYRVWGLDITPETTPLEAGLGFAVREKTRATLPEPRQALRCLIVDDPREVCLGGEPVRVDGAPVSRVTSGGYGYRVGLSIAYAYLPAGTEGRVEVGLNGGWTGARITPEPPYDPGNARVRATPWQDA